MTNEMVAEAIKQMEKIGITIIEKDSILLDKLAKF